LLEISGFMSQVYAIWAILDAVEKQKKKGTP